MPLSKQEWLALEKKAYELRKLTVQTTVWAGSGHFGGGMSVMDLLTVLYHKSGSFHRKVTGCEINTCVKSHKIGNIDSVFSKSKKLKDCPTHVLKYGVIADGDETIDDVVCAIFKDGKSYTGEDTIEISCHGSIYIQKRIIELLLRKGCKMAGHGEFTQRAYLNGRMDLSQAEAVADLIASTSAKAHHIAVKQMKGGFSSELRDMRSELLELVSLMELELDFSEEEVEFADRSRLDSLLENLIAHVSRLIDSFRLGNAIKNGVPVAIAGATNTGKSTLLNALLGEERAIVSDVHGTTRDTIEETLNIDGVLFRFIDTAGLRETSEIVEKIGIERTFKKLSEATIVLGMVDLTRDEQSTLETVSEILDKVDFKTQKLVILLNKVDISDINKNVSIENFIVSELENKGITSKVYENTEENTEEVAVGSGGPQYLFPPFLRLDENTKERQCR